MKNVPELWSEFLPVPLESGHKYNRGHSLILGSGVMTGAAVLASKSCMRIGSGLCTVLLPKTDIASPYSFPPHIIVQRIDGWADVSSQIEEKTFNAVLLGPGLADIPTETLRKIIIDILASDHKVILDASALSAFQGHEQDLFKAIKNETVLTPHMGEFKGLFPSCADDQDGVLKAAETSGAIVLLKGARTVIASPSGQCVENDHASPYLATAGSGDVLAGMITGLIAQGMPVYHATCAACWIHGDAALKFGAGLVADDLPDLLPDILTSISR